jgi:multidrug efflux pump subunit AcrA (membrane-fusion protein)
MTALLALILLALDAADVFDIGSGWPLALLGVHGVVTSVLAYFHNESHERFLDPAVLGAQREVADAKLEVLEAKLGVVRAELQGMLIAGQGYSEPSIWNRLHEIAEARLNVAQAELGERRSYERTVTDLDNVDENLRAERAAEATIEEMRARLTSLFDEAYDEAVAPSSTLLEQMRDEVDRRHEAEAYPDWDERYAELEKAYDLANAERGRAVRALYAAMGYDPPETT